MLSERKMELEHRVHTMLEENELLQSTVDDLRERTLVLKKQCHEKDLQVQRHERGTVRALSVATTSVDTVSTSPYTNSLIVYALQFVTETVTAPVRPLSSFFTLLSQVLPPLLRPVATEPARAPGGSDVPQAADFSAGGADRGAQPPKPHPTPIQPPV